MNDKLLILIVDDDEIDQIAIERVLKKTKIDHAVVIANSAKECISLLGDKKFDCILLDYLLPGMDGLALLTQIRELGVIVPVIMLTGHGDEELITSILSAGKSDYIPKSKLNADVLEHTILNLL